MLFMEREHTIQFDPEYGMSHNIYDIESEQAIHYVGCWASPIYQTQHIYILKHPYEGACLS